MRPNDEPLRWAFLPPLDPASIGWPALFVRVDPNPDQLAPPTDLFGEVRFAGLLQRDDNRGPIESWTAFVVSAPTTNAAQISIGPRLSSQLH